MTSDSSATDLELSYEDLAKRAQHFLTERPVLVLGTGATIPHGLPSMSTLADGLLAAITDHPEGWDAFAIRLDETKDLEQALHDVPLPHDTLDILVRATWGLRDALKILTLDVNFIFLGRP